MNPDTNTKPQTKIAYSEPVLPGNDPHITHQDTIPIEAINGIIRTYSGGSTPNWTPTGRGLDWIALVDWAGSHVLFVYNFSGGGWRGVNIT